MQFLWTKTHTEFIPTKSLLCFTLLGIPRQMYKTSNWVYDLKIEMFNEWLLLEPMKLKFAELDVGGIKVHNLKMVHLKEIIVEMLTML